MFGLDLRPTVSPFIQNGTDVSLRVQGNVCIGTTTPVDALSLCTAPVASATRGLLNLSNTALSGGSAAGTFISANPAACTGDFLNFQLADAARARLTCAGALTVMSSTNNLSIFAATTSAQLAGVLSNETGTGLVVFNTSPVLVTPDIGAATGTRLILTGVLQSSATADLGWTIQNAANQACNTTCTTGACVVGLDTAVLGNFLSCTDAAADTCLCAG